MKRGLVLVEGQTEERFVHDCLGPHRDHLPDRLLPSTGRFPRNEGSADRFARDRVGHVEAAWSRATVDRRFVPHLVLHEFEAWLYADPTRLEAWMFDDDPAIVTAIAEVAAAHASPEDIDEGFETAPSKRLIRAFAAYQKTLHGPLAVSAVGLERVRAACPHFDSWLGRLEAIARGEPIERPYA